MYIYIIYIVCNSPGNNILNMKNYKFVKDKSCAKTIYTALKNTGFVFNK